LDFEGKASLLVSEGHQHSRCYPLGWLLFQNALVAKRVNSRLAAEASLRRHSVWADKDDFKTIIENLNNEKD